MHYMHKKNFKFKPELSGNLGEHGQNTWWEEYLKQQKLCTKHLGKF